MQITNEVMFVINMFFLLQQKYYSFFSGITTGRVLNGEFYAQRLQKLIYQHLLTGHFIKISFQSCSDD